MESVQGVSKGKNESTVEGNDWEKMKPLHVYIPLQSDSSINHILHNAPRGPVPAY